MALLDGFQELNILFNSSQKLMKEIKLSEQALKNLAAFLARVDLKGVEVPAFEEIAEAIHKAQQPEEK